MLCLPRALVGVVLAMLPMPLQRSGAFGLLACTAPVSTGLPCLPSYHDLPSYHVFHLVAMSSILPCLSSGCHVFHLTMSFIWLPCLPPYHVFHLVAMSSILPCLSSGCHVLHLTMSSIWLPCLPSYHVFHLVAMSSILPWPSIWLPCLPSYHDRPSGCHVFHLTMSFIWLPCLPSYHDRPSGACAAAGKPRGYAFIEYEHKDDMKQVS